MKLRIANIIKAKQPEIYEKLLNMINTTNRKKFQFQNTNKLNFGGYSEQEFEEVKEGYARLMTEKRSVKI